MKPGLTIQIALVAMLSTSALNGFTISDVDFWVGRGPHRAVMVVDWHDQNALAWGYRFGESATAEDMLREIAESDRRMFARLGTTGPFGVPLYGVGFDRNQTGFALSDGTSFVDGIAITGPSDFATSVDPFDSYREGWFEGYWAIYESTDNPYANGAWQMSGSGISGLTLSDGSWSGLSFVSATSEAPDVPIAAFRRPSTHEILNLETLVSSVPEPAGFILILIASLFATSWSRNSKTLNALLLMMVIGISASNLRGSDFATTVVEYTPGMSVSPGFDDPAAALGMPTRFTSPDSNYGGPVTPFNAPFGTDELVTIGHGGSLVLGFDQPIMDRAVASEFGMDFIVFGNAFFFDNDFPNGIVAGVGAEAGVIEVSQNGTDWVMVSPMADALFPTMGYVDVTDAFPTVAGNVPTNFHQPVDPNLDPMGMDMPLLIANYAGSGGGTGVDIGTTGLDWIQFVRITNPTDSSSMITPEIDAITVVPEPSYQVLFCLLALCGLLKRNWH